MIDPILRNRVVSRVQAAVDEAEATFRSGAASPSIRDGETAVALFLPDGGVWCEGSGSAPFLAACLRVWMRVVADGENRDDAVTLLSNDPYAGGGTVCDLRMARPISLPDGEHAWIAAVAHYPDPGGRTVGGTAPGARSVHEEGVRVPLTAGTESVLSMLGANTRMPRAFRADLQAQDAALETGRSRLDDLGGTIGWASILEVGLDARDGARRAFAEARTALKPGRVVRRDRLEGDGTEGTRHLCLAAVISGDGLGLDFDGSASRSPGPTNCSRDSAVAACLAGVRAIFPEIPPAGVEPEDLEIRVPDGSLLDATFPAAVGGTSEVLAERVASLVVEALSETVHGRGRACDGGGGNVIVLEGTSDGRPYALRLVAGSGGGASGNGDGLTNVDPATRLSAFPPVEAIEDAFPVRVIRMETRAGSGGAGRYRGGDGAVLEIASLVPDGRLTVYADRGSRGAGGHHRGGRGSTSTVEVFTDGHWQPLPGRCQSVPIGAGDRVRVSTAGGGGYGHPYERAIRLVSDDVRSGRLTRKDAARRHGVVYTSAEARDYDSAKTFKLRSHRLTSADVDDFLDEIEALDE